MNDRKSLKLWGIFGLAIAAALLGITGFVYFNFGRAYTFQGTVLNPPYPAPDFVLTAQNGQPFRLSDLKGKVVLIFFGYTHCPDVCPATMAVFKQVKSQLGSQAERVRFIFVSVDPENDTPRVVGQFISRFDPSFTGLTGSRADLESVWKAYGVYQAKPTQPTGPTLTPDQVEHSSYIYVIDPLGDLHITYTPDIPVASMAQDLQHLMQSQ